MKSDYDGAWKDLLHRRYFEVLQCYFPSIVEGLDASVAPRFLDQELRELEIHENARENRVDVLAEVQLREGGARLLYLHLEVQSFREKEFAARLFHYYTGLRRFCASHNVVSLAVLADLDPHWYPNRYQQELLGCSIDFRFPCCKLLERLPQFENDHSLPALAAKAQIAALRTASDMDHRVAARLRLTRRLYEIGCTKAEVIEAYRLIAWMMKLPEPQRLIFKREILSLENTMSMPYLSDIEEMAMEEGLQKGLEKGREEGLEEGLRRSLLELLRIRFQTVPSEISERIAATHDLEQLRQWFNAAAIAETLMAFERELR